MTIDGSAGADDLDDASVRSRVRAFYETHPYPRPEDSLDRVRGRWTDPARRRMAYHLRWPKAPYREDRSVLVAGCGTSQAAKHALRWPAARVTGIDISATSIERSTELRARHRLGNLELIRIAVERVSELGRTFDHVVCTGVLHHLPDPDAGLRALRDVLAPGGALDLMVYAPYGRTGVYMIQEYCRRLGVGTSGDEIRDLASTLGALPEGHPLTPLLRDAPDFRTTAGLADALLHPQDRPYSVPELLDALHRSGLRFGRWLRQAPYLPLCGVPRTTPHGERLARLPPPEQYAAMELFRGTMLRHSVIAYRDDDPVVTSIRFDGRHGLDYVPIRHPDTVCVEERLPPGAAAVLINRSHTDTDLYLPIDARQKQWFDGIDGQRSIQEVVVNVGPAPGQTSGAKPRDLADAAVFFARLFSYDQIVVAGGEVGPLHETGSHPAGG
jgi:SAM-dependent methyltransferase